MERLGLPHPEIVAQAPNTPLPIREEASGILRTIHEHKKGTRRMIHILTMGHLDPAAVGRRQAIVLRPLDMGIVARLLESVP
jgi:hypothetical protein